ncbi:MAG TPA: glycosyltransferase, partial [Pyrinomonadaceae bacterium]|nr:glycosyltransferase [Pyrinomonadaceae bacterium]
GARAINDAMIAALPHLAARKNALHVTHQTGEGEFDKVQRGYEAASWQAGVEVKRYIDNMVSEFARADLIICRAGATTSAELVAAGKAAIMIPFPLAADDHQRKNAEALEKGGAARMILQKDLSGERLANEITQLLNEPQRITQMEAASRKLARRDAAAATVELMEELIRRK